MYILFAGDQYYPAGGAEDFVGVYDTVDEAKTVVAKDAPDWAHIAHLEDGDFLKAGNLVIEWEYASGDYVSGGSGWWNTAEYNAQFEAANKASDGEEGT